MLANLTVPAFERSLKQGAMMNRAAAQPAGKADWVLAAWDGIWALDARSEEHDVAAEPVRWRWPVMRRAVGLGGLCGVAPGAALGIFLMLFANTIPFWVMPLAGVVVGALAGAADGLVAGIALIACGPVVRRSRVAASLISGAAAAAIPLAVTLWLLFSQPRSAVGWAWPLAPAGAVFAGGAGLGPLAVGGKPGWTARAGGPPASSARPGAA